MAIRASIAPGFPGGNFVVELGQRASILPGQYLVEAGHAIVTIATGQIDALTLAATGQVIVAGASSPTIASPSLSAIGNIAVSATLSQTIDPITASATALVIRAGGDVAVPWWWEQYKARIEAERRAAAAQRRKAQARELDGYAVVPPPTGAGRLEFDIDTYPDLEFIAGLAPWLLLEPA
jgi:hypothetical protein